MTPAKRIARALADVDAALTIDEQHDPDTLYVLGQLASDWAIDKLSAARSLRRDAYLAEHPSLFVEDVPTGDLV